MKAAHTAEQDVGETHTATHLKVDALASQEGVERDEYVLFSSSSLVHAHKHFPA